MISSSFLPWAETIHSEACSEIITFYSCLGCFEDFFFFGQCLKYYFCRTFSYSSCYCCNMQEKRDSWTFCFCKGTNTHLIIASTLQERKNTHWFVQCSSSHLLPLCCLDGFWQLDTRKMKMYFTRYNILCPQLLGVKKDVTFLEQWGYSSRALCVFNQNASFFCIAVLNNNNSRSLKQKWAIIGPDCLIPIMPPQTSPPLGNFTLN